MTRAVRTGYFHGRGGPVKSVARARPRTVTVSAPPAKAYTLRALLFGALAVKKQEQMYVIKNIASI